MTRCECEHHSHLNKGFKTPNGKDGHHYAAIFPTPAMIAVQTPRGKFVVCEACAKDCYAQWYEKQNFLKEMGHGQL